MCASLAPRWPCCDRCSRQLIERCDFWCKCDENIRAVRRRWLRQDQDLKNPRQALLRSYLYHNVPLLLLSISKHVCQSLPAKEGSGRVEGDGLHQLQSQIALFLRVTHSGSDVVHSWHSDWGCGRLHYVAAVQSFLGGCQGWHVLPLDSVRSSGRPFDHLRLL